MGSASSTIEEVVEEVVAASSTASETDATIATAAAAIDTSGIVMASFASVLNTVLAIPEEGQYTGDVLYNDIIEHMISMGATLMVLFMLVFFIAPKKFEFKSARHTLRRMTGFANQPSSSFLQTDDNDNDSSNSTTRSSAQVQLSYIRNPDAPDKQREDDFFKKQKVMAIAKEKEELKLIAKMDPKEREAMYEKKAAADEHTKRKEGHLKRLNNGFNSVGHRGHGSQEQGGRGGSGKRGTGPGRGRKF
jgi:hypothetical protein